MSTPFVSMGCGSAEFATPPSFFQLHTDAPTPGSFFFVLSFGGLRLVCPKTLIPFALPRAHRGGTMLRKVSLGADRWFDEDTGVSFALESLHEKVRMWTIITSFQSVQPTRASEYNGRGFQGLPA